MGSSVGWPLGSVVWFFSLLACLVAWIVACLLGGFFYQWDNSPYIGISNDINFVDGLAVSHASNEEVQLRTSNY